MSTTSQVNSPDYMQYLSAQLPAFPATGQPSSAAGAPGQPPNLTHLLSLLGIDPTEAAAATEGVHTTQGSSSKGQKYTGRGATSNLPPPRAPRTTMTPYTAKAYASLAYELNTAQSNSQVRLATDPSVQYLNQPPQGRIDLNTDPQVAAATATAWLKNSMDSLQAGQGDLMTEFMTLRLKNSQNGLKELSDLSDLCTSIQDTQLQEEQAKSREADKEAHKAQKKAAMMGILSPILTVVIAVVTAIIAIATLGLGTGLALVAAAAAIAFLAGALANGKGHGGFNVMSGLNMATYAADAMLLAIGIGAALMAVQEIVATAAKAGAKAAVKSGIKAGTKTAVNETAKKSKEVVATSLEKGSKIAIKTQAEGATKAETKAYLKDMAKAGYKVSYKEATKEAAKQGSEKAATSSAKAAAEAGAKEVSKGITGDMLKEEVLEETMKQTEKKIGKEISEMSARDKKDLFISAFKQKFTKNMEAMGKEVIPGDFGTKMMLAGVVMGGAEALSALITGVIQYNVTMHQTKAEEDQALVKLLSSVVDMLNDEYATIQDCTQSMVQSHSKAVDATQACLKNNAQVNSLISNNMVTR